MMTRFDPEASASWLTRSGREGDVVVSSRVRLARNMAGFPFVHRATDDQREAIKERAQECLMDSGIVGRSRSHLMWVDLAGLHALDRRVLLERNLISQQQAKSEPWRGLAVSTPDEEYAVMVNEEDHLRLQVVRPGLDLTSAFREAITMDDRLESRMDYAFSLRFGYLTACPTNLGTGIRVSVMLHLPALKLTGEMDKFKRATKAMSLAVRGVHGEGSDTLGDFCQVSNQVTLGRSEQDILMQFEHEILPQILDFERSSRRTLLSKRRVMLEDQVQRALGVLRSARIMKAEEATQLLSQVRLGVATELVSGITLEQLTYLTVLIQPGHLQRLVGRPLDQAERRIERATMLRERLTSACG